MADLQERYVEYDQVKSSQCGLCLQLAERPRALPCLHAFCEGCLREYAHGKRRLKCPVCRERVKLPSEGVSALPDNNGVRSHTKKLNDYAQITPSEDTIRGEGTQKCVHHPWEDLRLVCQHCHVPVCLQCLDEMHEGHSAVSFKRVSRRRKITVRKLVTEGKRTLDDYYTTLQSLQDMQNTLDESKKRTEQDVHARYDDVLRGLAEERATLLFDIEDNHMRDSAAIEAQRKNVASRVSDLDNAINSAEKGMERGVRESDVLLQVLDKCKETPPLPDPPVQAQLPVFMPEESYSRVLGHLTWQPLTANKDTDDLEKDHLSPNNGTLLETSIDPSDRKTPESQYPPKGQIQSPEYVNVSPDFIERPSPRSPSAVRSNKMADYSSPIPDGSPNLGRGGYNVNGLGASKSITSPATKANHHTGLTKNTRVREPIVGSIQELREFRRGQEHIPSHRESPFSTDHPHSPIGIGVTQTDQARDNNIRLGPGSPGILMGAQQTSRQAKMRLSPPEHSPRLSSGSDIPDDGFYRHYKPEQVNRRHRVSSDSDNVDHAIAGGPVDAIATQQAQPSRTTPTYRETSSEDGTHVEYSSGFYRVVRGKKKRPKSSSGSGIDVKYDQRETSTNLQETNNQSFDSRNVDRYQNSRQEEQVMPRTPTPSRQHSERRHGGPILNDASPRTVDELQQQDELSHDWPEVVPKRIEDEVLKEIARMSQSSRESEHSDNSEPRRRKQVVEAKIEQDGTKLPHNKEEVTDVPNLSSHKRTVVASDADIRPLVNTDVSSRSGVQNVQSADLTHHDYVNIVTERDQKEESRDAEVPRPQEIGRSSTYSDEDPHSPASPDSDVFTPKYTEENTSNSANIPNLEYQKTKHDDDSRIRHLSGEIPRRVSTNKRGLSFGGEGSDVGKFSGPSGVFVIADEIYVADQDNNRVQAFSMRGECLGELPTLVSASPQSPTKGKPVPMEPHDVAVDTNDNIWVVGSDGMTSDFILRYDMEGRPLTKIDLPFTGYWRGIAVHTHRKFIVVSEPFGGEVKLFAPPRGTLIRTLGGESGLKAPWYVAVDNDGKIYVSDWSGHYIYVFQDNGKMLLRFGGEGSEEGQLQCPCGVCVDGDGNIIVADSLNQRVEMFDKAGTFVKHIATDLQGPQAVAMVKDGTIVVTETDKNSVSIYHY